ncbi:MAG: DNA repair protein RadA [Dehalococcoidales bacterium]|nr:DNA repair protein RadA [Dehalococcoidales bacterium]
MSKSNRPESKSLFVCQQCGKESLKWLGRCPNCQEWNTLVEKTVVVSTSTFSRTAPMSPPEELSQVSIEENDRLVLPLNELNRVLGGGLVAGSLVLVGGDPGIGKSTLLLQVSALVANARGRVAYVTGEETLHQVKLRAHRLGINGGGLFLLAETNLDTILGQMEDLAPGMVVIDSIQAVYLPQLDSSSGSINQVRECAGTMMRWAKTHGIPVFLVGHVTKEGAIAGPRVLEHMVDVVLYLEGEPFSPYRVLRGVKNRFGSTNEIGVFEMKGQGLVEVDNPSQAFLSQRGDETIGSVVVPTFEGTRPLLIEVQALTNPTSFGLPRRTGNGVDFNRLLLITAVLSRRAGLKLGNQDVLVNVTGGLKIDEPAADLGIALAIASSLRDAGVDRQTAVVGEIGLSGEIRAVQQLERRINEAARLGFKRCLVPKANMSIDVPSGVELIPVGTLREAIKVGLGVGTGHPEE